MTPDQFTNWLSGFISALGSNPPTDEQFNIVKENLGKVFNKVTPNRKEENIFERYVVPDCGLINNDGVLGGHILVGNSDKPSSILFSNKEEVNQFFEANPLDSSTRALLENYTGPLDSNGQEAVSC
jgi:hypothetical protein